MKDDTFHSAMWSRCVTPPSRSLIPRQDRSNLFFPLVAWNQIRDLDVRLSLNSSTHGFTKGFTRTPCIPYPSKDQWCLNEQLVGTSFWPETLWRATSCLTACASEPLVWQSKNSSGWSRILGSMSVMGVWQPHSTMKSIRSTRRHIAFTSQSFKAWVPD